MRRKKLVESDLGIMLREDVAMAMEALLKTLPTSQRTLKRQNLTSKSESIDEGKRREVSIITTNSVDLAGDVVVPEGVDRTYFDRNPVVCLAHDMNEQVGTCDWIKPSGSGLKAQTYYPAKPKWYKGEWLSDQVFALIQAGLMLGKSIGFIATNIRQATKDELALNPTWKEAQVIDKAVLLEYSCCVSGMNQDALVVAINKGMKVSHKLLGTQPKVSKTQRLINKLEANWGRIERELLVKYGLDL